MQEKILLVDDNPRLLSGMKLALEMKDYVVVTAANGLEALTVLRQGGPALIVSDIKMPGLDGFMLLEKVHSNPEWVTIPFLFLTAMNDPESIEHARSLGADDYLTKPFTTGALAQAVRARLDRSQTLENAYYNDANLRMVMVLANAIEVRDACTGGHVERVMKYAETLAMALNWPEQQIKEVQLAAVLHDVGKVSLPDSVLNNPGHLTPQEWEIMRGHPQRGCEILSPLHHSPHVMNGVRYHHERYDGQGYPERLIGTSIPAVGRLLAIVDAYDAMTSQRPYRNSLQAEIAIERLRQGAGSQFDPQMVEVFIQILQ